MNYLMIMMMIIVYAFQDPLTDACHLHNREIPPIPPSENVDSKVINGMRRLKMTQDVDHGS